MRSFLSRVDRHFRRNGFADVRDPDLNLEKHNGIEHIFRTRRAQDFFLGRSGEIWLAPGTSGGSSGQPREALVSCVSELFCEVILQYAGADNFHFVWIGVPRGLASEFFRTLPVGRKAITRKIRVMGPPSHVAYF